MGGEDEEKSLVVGGSNAGRVQHRIGKHADRPLAILPEPGGSAGGDGTRSRRPESTSRISGHRAGWSKSLPSKCARCATCFFRRSKWSHHRCICERCWRDHRG